MNAPVSTLDHDTIEAFTEISVLVSEVIPSVLPFPFIPVSAMLPVTDKPVLAIRLSGYVTAKYEVLTAKYMPTYRPRNPWQTIANDAVTDSGEETLGWIYADKLLC